MKKKITIILCLAVFIALVFMRYSYVPKERDPFPTKVSKDELIVHSKEKYHSVDIYQKGNMLVINADSESEFFDGMQFTVETQGEITPEDVEIIWKNMMGRTEKSDDEDFIIAEIRISENNELIFGRKVNFFANAFKIVDEVLNRNME